MTALLFRFSGSLFLCLSAAFFLDTLDFLCGLFNDRLLFLTYSILFLYCSCYCIAHKELAIFQIVRICKTQLYLCFR